MIPHEINEILYQIWEANDGFGLGISERMENKKTKTKKNRKPMNV